MLKSEQKRGFSLIEIMVYVSILSFVIISVISLFLWSNRTQAKSRAITEVVSNSNRAIEIITGEIIKSDGIYYPTSTTTQISLYTSNQVPAGETRTYIDIYLCGNRVCLKRESQDPVAITSEDVYVNDLRFLQISTSTSPSIRITLSLDHVDFRDRTDFRTTYNITTTASLRTF